MNKHTEKRFVFWASWNYEKREKWFDERSEHGLHLEKPGVFLNTFTRDDHARYIYRIDYQPDLRKKGQIQEYTTLYDDSGWEYVGGCVGWHYFRRRWVPGENHELYTDRASLKQNYKRIQRVMGLLFLVNLGVFGVNANNLLMHFSGKSLWYTVIPVLAVYAAMVFLLGYGYAKMGRKVRGIER